MSDRPRVRVWVDNFLDSDNELMVKVGRNFEYLLDHVDDWESGDLSFQDLPEMEFDDKWLIVSSVSYGVYWGFNDAEVFAVSDSDESFVGLYGHVENAEGRADELSGNVESFEPIGPSRQRYVDRFLDKDEKPQQIAGKVFEFMLDNDEAFRTGDLSPDEFPDIIEQNTKWLIAYSTLFGMLWELSHPSLHGVFDEDGALVDIYWNGREALRVAMSNDADWRSQRLSIADGDLPPEEVIGEIGPKGED